MDLLEIEELEELAAPLTKTEIAAAAIVIWDIGIMVAGVIVMT
jgi:hypothetical protein